LYSDTSAFDTKSRPPKIGSSTVALSLGSANEPVKMPSLRSVRRNSIKEQATVLERSSTTQKVDIPTWQMPGISNIPRTGAQKPALVHQPHALAEYEKNTSKPSALTNTSLGQSVTHDSGIDGYTTALLHSDRAGAQSPQSNTNEQTRSPTKASHTIAANTPKDVPNGAAPLNPRYMSTAVHTAAAATTKSVLAQATCVASIVVTPTMPDVTSETYKAGSGKQQGANNAALGVPEHSTAPTPSVSRIPQRRPRRFRPQPGVAVALAVRGARTGAGRGGRRSKFMPVRKCISDPNLYTSFNTWDNVIAGVDVARVKGTTTKMLLGTADGGSTLKTPVYTRASKAEVVLPIIKNNNLTTSHIQHSTDASVYTKQPAVWLPQQSFGHVGQTYRRRPPDTSADTNTTQRTTADLSHKFAIITAQPTTHNVASQQRIAAGATGTRAYIASSKTQQLVPDSISAAQSLLLDDTADTACSGAAYADDDKSDNSESTSQLLAAADAKQVVAGVSAAFHTGDGADEAGMRQVSTCVRVCVHA
jgi:hypothetical protein